MSPEQDAPGAPGISPRWTSSAKTAVGTSLSSRSRVWFALSHGIVDEIYYPRIDTACTRDLGLLISDDSGKFLEEKRHARSTVRWLGEGVPAFELTNQLPGEIGIRKEILTDPERDVLLHRTTIEGVGADVHVTALLAPHINNRGGDNIAWVGEYKGIPMLFASGSDLVLALAADTEWALRSVGYVGFSDGWQDVHSNGRLTWTYPRAGPGNVAMAGEVSVPASGTFTLAVGFGRTAGEAGYQARSSLADGVDRAVDRYMGAWKEWADSLESPPATDPFEKKSRTVIRIHESLSFPGASIASLSIPWGFTKGDKDMGGYHLVWPRDMVETLGALLACGSYDEARRGIDYLRSTQEADGHWAQNMWLDGSPYWNGVQMDETALPILAVGLARRSGCPLDPDAYWPMVRDAAGYLVGNGPVTGQDRWEEDAGYSPFTVGAQVAALTVAAAHAHLVGETQASRFLLETADDWNDAIERWMYVAGTDLAAEVGVAGYYVRIASPDVAEGASPASGWTPIKNRPAANSSLPAAEIVSPDSLALVRFGLRSPTDQRILDTIDVIDHLLRVELPSGPTWRRYTEDGYGEHADGSPFDGTGIGRPWPLLTGERAHYELAAGNRDGAVRLARAIRSFAGPNGLLPEQVWDAGPLPDRELFPGGPTGSAMPLVWAHAEYVKLMASLRLGRVFDTPDEATERYLAQTRIPRVGSWAPHHKLASMAAGRHLRIDLPAPSMIRWTTDAWQTYRDVDTAPMLGVHSAEVPTAGLAPGTQVEFTTRRGDQWEGVNRTVEIV